MKAIKVNLEATIQQMKNSPLKRGKPLRARGKSESSVLKDEIQKLLREIAIKRDKSCVFRNYPETGKCGGYRKDGELILQFDHLNSRSRAVSYSDSRLGICVCKRHHLYYKRQYPAKYEEVVRKIIGKKRCELLDKVRADERPYKADLQLEIIGLKQELRKYE